ncbi:S-layer homology domain-containing protein [Paenibacillus sp. SYP-B4298]|uniref:S-layer homology domain-containing protein n=1 Tax=Paenibacillus sp. SYP-B4298 TaxID=2996034 RepID=UPI0022DDE53E|nr:S-layer homology domain-containing protein [Paenibacillus sp. SYP-B4298]
MKTLFGRRMLALWLALVLAVTGLQPALGAAAVQELAGIEQEGTSTTDTQQSEGGSSGEQSTASLPDEQSVAGQAEAGTEASETDGASASAPGAELEPGEEAVLQPDTGTAPVDTVEGTQPESALPSQAEGDLTQAGDASAPLELKELRALIEGAGKWIVDRKAYNAYDPFNDWDAMALVRSGLTLPESPYYDYVRSSVIEVGGDFSKATDPERIAMAVTAIGKDARNVGGYDLIDKFIRHGMVAEAANALTFALIALDTRHYEVPAAADIGRDELIARLLTMQSSEGAFLINQTEDVDTTAMALQALSGYTDRPQVKQAVDSALAWLSSIQRDTGGFGSVLSPGESSESSAQVIIALTSLGIDPASDARFQKLGRTAIDALIAHLDTSGGFKHELDQKVSYIATHQAMLALNAYERFLTGKPKLYDMSDAEGTADDSEYSTLYIVSPRVKVTLTPYLLGSGLSIVVEPRNSELSITLPQDHTAPIGLQTLGSRIPKLELTYGDVSLSWPRTTGGKGALFQLPMLSSLSNEELTAAIEADAAPAKVVSIGTAIELSGPSFKELKAQATLKFAGHGKLQAGFWGSDDLFKQVPRANDPTQDMYAYEDNGSLIVQTNAFGRFVTYALDEPGGENPGTNPGTDPGTDPGTNPGTDPGTDPGTNPGTGTPSPGNGGGHAPQVKLSIEKISIGQGYIIEPVYVELKSGDTAFTLMERYAESQGKSVAYRGSADSLYVEGIDGLSEFDHGIYSGWMYSVNDSYPSYSAGTKTLQAGDVLRWRYTKDLGKDIGGFDSIIGGQNREVLRSKVNEVKGLVATDYTAASWNELKRVLELAEKTLNESGSDSLELVKLLKELTDAQNKLVAAGQGTGVAGSKAEESKKVLPEKLDETIRGAADWIAASANFAEYDPFHDWDALALARAGRTVPAAYYETLEQYIRDNGGRFRKVTDYERTALAAAAIGKDPTNIAGYNFLERIYNNERMTAQGTNGAIYALLALDAVQAVIPPEAAWSRSKLVEWLLEQQNTDGGFPLSKEEGGASDVDVTAMALQALAGYSRQERVMEATSQALSWLSGQQLASGGMNAWGQENSESVAQVIIALSALGIPLDDPRFVKAQGNLYSNLRSFVNQDGGIAHTAGGASNYMATHQGLLGLLAYKRALQQEKGVYDFSDLRGQAEQMEQTEEETPLYGSVTGFRDEGSISAWALEAVGKAVGAGIVQGAGQSGRFEPQRNMTRAEFASMLVRMLGLAIEQPHDSVYTDVMNTQWYASPIMAATRAGLVQGGSKGMFTPNEAITRQEMMVMLGRAFGFADAVITDDDLLPDDLKLVAPWAERSVVYFYNQNLLPGAKGNVYPEAPVTRELAVVLLLQLQQQQAARTEQPAA